MFGWIELVKLPERERPISAFFHSFDIRDDTFRLLYVTDLRHGCNMMRTNLGFLVSDRESQSHFSALS